jgi:phosphatidylglycerophosphatase A
MEPSLTQNQTNPLYVWVAQGFGIGRIPWAPGTLGSCLGLVWFAILSLTGSAWIFLAGVILGFFLSVWIGGRAESILGQKDPGSVVIDEIMAVPFCFLSAMELQAHRTGHWPGPAAWWDTSSWFIPLVVFGLFRLFDVWKPGLVRQSQSLPGGWGLTVDDFLAAVYVNLVVGAGGLALR